MRSDDQGFGREIAARILAKRELIWDWMIGYWHPNLEHFGVRSPNRQLVTHFTTESTKGTEEEGRLE